MRALLLAAVAACAPSSGPPLSRIDSPRVIALRGTPAEAPPGAAVTWDALVALDDGAPLAWSLCRTPRPLTTNDVVSPDCLSRGDALGSAPSVNATLPDDACQLFGPELANARARSVAADASGGFYQPYRAALGSADSIGLQRLACPLAGATADVAAEFHMRYTPNQNPQPGPLRIGDAPADGATVTAGARVTLTVDWPTDEIYPVLDVATETLVDHREAMRVSWYASGGDLDEERTGRAADDPASSSDNVLTPSAGAVQIWAVVRDDRGGVGWVHASLTAQ